MSEVERDSRESEYIRLVDAAARLDEAGEEKQSVRLYLQAYRVGRALVKLAAKPEVRIRVENGTAFVDHVANGLTVEVTDYDVEPGGEMRDECGRDCSRYSVPWAAAV